MKVYFVNGDLNKLDSFPNIPEGYYVLDASKGYWYCVQTLSTYSLWDNCVVLTNFVGALKSDVCFNKTSQKFDLFLVSPSDNKWHNVQDLTSKGLRYAHNIEKMYRAGEFGMSVSNSRQVWEYVVDKVIGNNDSNVCAWLTGSRLLGYSTDTSDYDVDIVVVPTLDQLKLGNVPKERRGVEQYCVDGTNVTVEYVVRDALKEMRMIRYGDVRANLVGEVINVNEYCGNSNVFSTIQRLSFATQHTMGRLDSLTGFVHNKLKGWDNKPYTLTGLKCLVQAARYALIISRDFVDFWHIPCWEQGEQTKQLLNVYREMHSWLVKFVNDEPVPGCDDMDLTVSEVKKLVTCVIEHASPYDKEVTDETMLNYVNSLLKCE